MNTKYQARLFDAEGNEVGRLIETAKKAESEELVKATFEAGTSADHAEIVTLYKKGASE